MVINILDICFICNFNIAAGQIMLSDYLKFQKNLLWETTCMLELLHGRKALVYPLQS
jgi:hypothetical protein